MNKYFIKKKAQEVQKPKLFSLKKDDNFLTQLGDEQRRMDKNLFKIKE